MQVKISGQYALLSRGRISAKHQKLGHWAEKEAGAVILDASGKWMVSQTDGFQRKETVYVEVDDAGNVKNLGSRMWVVI